MYPSMHLGRGCGQEGVWTGKVGWGCGQGVYTGVHCPMIPTEAGGTHPTGMHSCLELYSLDNSKDGFFVNKIHSRQGYGIKPKNVLV